MLKQMDPGCVEAQGYRPQDSPIRDSKRQLRRRVWYTYVPIKHEVELVRYSRLPAIIPLHEMLALSSGYPYLRSNVIGSGKKFNLITHGSDF